MNNARNDQEIKELLKRAVENVKVPKNLIDKCIDESRKSNVASGNVPTFSSSMNKVHENVEEEDRTKEVYTNLSNSFNQIIANRAEDWKKALAEFLHKVKEESTADVMTCYLSQTSELPKKDELKIFTKEGTWFPHKMGGLVKRRNIPLLLLDKEPKVFDDAGADYIFSDSDFLRREKVKSVISLPFRSNSQRGIVFLSYRKGSTVPPEIGKLLNNNVPRWLSVLLSDKRTSPQDKPGLEQEIENRDFAELIKKTAVEGLTDERIGEILKTLSVWLNLRNVFSSWHEIDQENRTIRLRYICFSEEKGKPLTYDKVECSLDENQGFVAEAAQTGTYVLVDDIYENRELLEKYQNLPIRGDYPLIRSELAVPLNRYDGIHVGVLNLESSEEGRFNEGHARQIEKVGQAIIIAAETYNMLSRTHDSFSQNISQPMSLPNQNLAKSLNTLFDTFILKNHKMAPEVSEDVQTITDLALNLFNASAVDIWQYDHEKQEFSSELGLSLSDAFKEKCDKQNLTEDDLREKFQPRKNGNSQLLMEQTNKIKRIKDAADKSEQHNASPDTTKLGIRGLLGVPIVGPQSTYPDGVMWLRFDKSIDFNHDFIETARKLAGFVHMLWNPLSYYPTKPNADVSASDPDYFNIGESVAMNESLMNDDQEYEKNMRGTVAGKDSNMYRVRLVNGQHVCVWKGYLTRAN